MGLYVFRNLITKLQKPKNADIDSCSFVFITGIENQYFRTNPVESIKKAF